MTQNWPHDVFYQPADGFVGDIIPYVWDGLYHVFYLKAPPLPLRETAESNRTPWAHLVSDDLVHWEEWPVAIEPGGAGEPDHAGCWTGAVIHREGTFYMFYTGATGPDLPQTICRATSHDLRTWVKDPANPVLRADPRWYEPVDWRDPFVFWNEQAAEYWMLLAARTSDGPVDRRGCTGLATSPDLERWTVKPPFWAPRLYSIPHECPDLFRWQGQWVLLFSESSDRTVTRYRMATSLDGPWTAPPDDTFDDRAFYAAKTVGDGSRRFLLGWVPTREGGSDSGRWEWAGTLVAHELREQTDGRIGAGPLPEVAALFSQPQHLSVHPLLGQWGEADGSFRGSAPGGFAACLLGATPARCQIDLIIKSEASVAACGLLLRAEQDLAGYVQVRWECGAERLSIDHWPRPGHDHWPRPDDRPYIVTRPLKVSPDEPLSLRVILEGDILIAYANNVVALSCRVCQPQVGQLGLFVEGGSATFGEMRVMR